MVCCMSDGEKMPVPGSIVETANALSERMEPAGFLNGMVWRGSGRQRNSQRRGG